MAAVKVNPKNAAATDRRDPPKIIRIERQQKNAPVTYEPELVRVRAVARGYYAVREVMKDPRDGQFKIVRNDIIRNPGEVFDMDTADMRTLPLGKALKDAISEKEHPHTSEFGVTEIETERGQFELPSWVVLADEAGVAVEEPTGHKTTFGKKEGEVL